MQFSGKLRSDASFKEAEALVLAIPGVTQFVQVFPNADPSGPLFWLFVVDAEASAQVELNKVALFEGIEPVSPRFISGQGPT